MGEILLWTIAVFAVLAGPPLLVLWSDLRGERKEGGRREPQHRPVGDGENTRRRRTGARPSSSTGLWPAMYLLGWTG